MQRSFTRSWVLGFVLLAACAALPPRNPPRIDVVGVALDRVEGPDAYFTVAVVLANDGDDEIVVDALQGSLAIEGERVAEASLVTGPVRIPPRGSASAELVARTGMDAVLRAVAAAMRRGGGLAAPGVRPTLHYAIEGSATLNGGFRLPFSRSGDIGEGRR
jgi:hypothetical protein